MEISMRNILTSLLSLTLLFGCQTTSKVIVEEESKEVGKMSENLFIITQNGKKGFINERGKVVIKPQFSWGYGFSERLARVKGGSDDKYGYIDKKGNFVIEPQFQLAYDFSEGLARVRLHGGKYGYIDKTGKVAIETQFDRADDFSEGLAKINIGGRWKRRAVMEFVGGKYGYIDKTGKTVISNPTFEDARDFSEGLARVMIDGRWGYIDKTGEMVIKPQFGDALDFSEGLAAVNKSAKGGKYGYMDKTGKMVIKPQFDMAHDFSEGLACVEVGFLAGEWMYIDKTGKTIIKPHFSFPQNFSEGLACVRIKGKWGFIDKKGKIVIEPQFDRKANFSKGLAYVKTNDSEGYIDKTGKFIWKSAQSEKRSSLQLNLQITPDLELKAIIKNISNKTQAFYFGIMNRFDLVLTNSKGEKIEHSAEIEIKIKPYHPRLNDFTTLKPGEKQEITSKFEKDKMGYDLRWSLKRYFYLQPGTYKAKVVWEFNKFDYYYDEKNEKKKLENAFNEKIESIESNEVSFHLPKRVAMSEKQTSIDRFTELNKEGLRYYKESNYVQALESWEEAFYQTEIMEKEWDVIEEVRTQVHQTVKHLISLTSHQDPQVRSGALLCLNKTGGEEARAAFIKALKDTSYDVRCDVCHYLHQNYAPDILPALIHELGKNPNDFIREEIALIIGKIGEPKAIPELRKFFEKEKDAFAKYNILLAMARLKDPESQNVILNRLQNNKKFIQPEEVIDYSARRTPKDVKMLYLALKEFEYMNDENLASRLLPLLNDERDAVNMAPSGHVCYIRVCDVAINILDVVLNHPFKFKVERWRRYTPSELSEAKQLLNAKK